MQPIAAVEALIERARTAAMGGLRALHRPLVDSLFALLLTATLIAAGWLVARHDHYWDWTTSRDNSLSEESLRILDQLDGPLRATVFIDPRDPLAKPIEGLLARYARVLPALEVKLLDPQLFPEQTRDARVSISGQVLLEHQGRRETLSTISERAVTAAIARLTTNQAPWVAVLEGHGERRIDGEGPTDLGRFGQELDEHGFLVRHLDLATVADVPVNTHLALVSTPAIALFPGEAERLGEYIDRGGNLLWLLDPGPLNGLELLANQLGIRVLPGTVVDARAASLGLDTPAVAVITDFPDDALAGGLRGPALLPGAVAFETETAPGWSVTSFLVTGDDSWNETGRIEGDIFRDEVVGEQAGPLAVVLALTRPLGEDGRVQRVLLVGDGDFLSNAQIGSYGNRELGLRMLRWLSGEDGLLALPPDPDPAQGLTLDQDKRLLLGLGSLVLLPGFFLTAGLAVRWFRGRG